MTKSTTYFGKRKTIKFAETLETVAPTIKAYNRITLVHNTNVSVNLIDTETTLDVTNWKECADFHLTVYPNARNNKAYIDDGVVTLSGTRYPSGLNVIAGYTTALVSGYQQTVITMTGGTYGSVEKMYAPPHQTNVYQVYVGFTDLYGVAHAIQQFIVPGRAGFYIDLKQMKLDRSIDLVVKVTFWNTTDTHGLEDNATILGANVYCYVFSPVVLQFGCYNSIDEIDFTQPFPYNAYYSSVHSYISKYKMFLVEHAGTFNQPVENWIDILTQGAAFAVDMGWMAVTEFDDLLEVRDYSFALVGLLSKCLAGNFDDVSIPSHFGDRMADLINSGNGAEGIALLAAIWALSDDLFLEVSV